jgi:hypothetical protein
VTPTLTKLERDALKLLIKFAWGQHGATSYHDARQLVIKALELDDSRPVDIEKRKAALNTFCDTPSPRT